MTDNTPELKREPKLVPGDTAEDATPRSEVKPLRPVDDRAPAQDEPPAIKPVASPEPAPADTADVAKEAPQPKRGAGRFFTRLILLGVIPLIAIAVGVWFYVNGGRIVKTENAYVKTNIVAVSSDLSGRVVDVLVSDNARVNEGDLLFRLDDQALQLKLAEAEAELAVISSSVESTRAGYREALDEAQELRAELKFLERDATRYRKLFERGIGTEQNYDRARTLVESQRRKISAAQEKANRVLATLGSASSGNASQHPRYVRAEATRAVAVDQLSRIEVRAPSAGVVSNMRLQAGEWVEDGKPVFSILDIDELWIEANLKETQLTNVVVGQAVAFSVDAYPDHEFKARIQHIAPATGSEFSLLPPQNATGNWVKVVQRVPVIVEIEPDPSAPPLRAGMTAAIAIDTEKSRSLPPAVQDFARQAGLPPVVMRWLNIAPSNPDG